MTHPHTSPFAESLHLLQFRAHTMYNPSSRNCVQQPNHSSRLTFFSAKSSMTCTLHRRLKDVRDLITDLCHTGLVRIDSFGRVQGGRDALCDRTFSGEL